MILTEEWDWSLISHTINIEEVIRYPWLPWDLRGLSSNETFRAELIDTLHLPNSCNEWDYWGLSSIASMDYILKHPDKNWDRHRLAYNKGITLEMALKYDLFATRSYHSIYGTDWMESSNVNYISRGIDMDVILNNTHLPWSLSGLSSNKGITLDIINNVKFPNAIEEWDLSHVSNIIEDMSGTDHYWYAKSKYSPIIDVISHPEYTWDRNGLSHNKQLSIDIIDNLELPNATGEWEWWDISRVIGGEDILNYRNKPWCVEQMFLNKNLTRTMFDWDSIEQFLPNSMPYMEWWGYPEYTLWNLYDPKLSHIKVERDELSGYEYLRVADIFALDGLIIPIPNYSIICSKSLSDIDIIY